MYYDLKPFDDLVEQGYLRRFSKGNLVGYKYTDSCTHEKKWDEYTRIARGIVFEKDTGLLVAKPFPKFFNLGEMPESSLSNLPNEPYTCYEKYDGSLGIIYWYDDKWNINTCGSFDSDQAIEGDYMLNTYYDLTKLNKNYTYLVEIIYPENKIVVHYKDVRDLVLIGVYDRNTSVEVPLDNCYGVFRFSDSFDYSIDKMIELQSELSKDEEGFVVRFASGMRLKIKGKEYLRIHKMISNMSPLSFWEVMENGVVDRKYIQELPEEFRDEFEPMIASLEHSYDCIRQEIEEEHATLPTEEGRKAMGLYMKANKLRHEGAHFSKYLNQDSLVDKYIMKYIRPHANQLN